MILQRRGGSYFFGLNSTRTVYMRVCGNSVGVMGLHQPLLLVYFVYHVLHQLGKVLMKQSRGDKLQCLHFLRQHKDKAKHLGVFVLPQQNLKNKSYRSKPRRVTAER